MNLKMLNQNWFCINLIWLLWT